MRALAIDCASRTVRVYKCMPLTGVRMIEDDINITQPQIPEIAEELEQLRRGSIHFDHLPAGST